jgi:hypothetical protein
MSTQITRSFSCDLCGLTTFVNGPGSDTPSGRKPPEGWEVRKTSGDLTLHFCPRCVTTAVHPHEAQMMKWQVGEVEATRDAWKRADAALAFVELVRADYHKRHPRPAQPQVRVPGYCSASPSSDLDVGAWSCCGLPATHLWGDLPVCASHYDAIQATPGRFGTIVSRTVPDKGTDDESDLLSYRQTESEKARTRTPPEDKV